MRRSTTLIISAVAALGLAAAALPVVAQQAQMPFGGMMRGGFTMMGGNTAMHDEHFAAIDTNGDGTLSDEEIAAGIKAELAKYDTDGNGTLSLEEFAAMQAEMQAEMIRTMTVRAFQMHDADGDGQVTEAEMAAFAAQMGQMQAQYGGMGGIAHGGMAGHGMMGNH